MDGLITKQHTQIMECRPVHSGQYVCGVCGLRGVLGAFKTDNCKPTHQMATSGWSKAA